MQLLRENYCAILAFGIKREVNIQIKWEKPIKKCICFNRFQKICMHSTLFDCLRCTHQYTSANQLVSFAYAFAVLIIIINNWFVS